MKNMKKLGKILWLNHYVKDIDSTIDFTENS